MNTPAHVKSASRTLRLFQAFAEAGRPLSLSELARALDIPRSSCLALLRTIASKGFLCQVGPNAYYPTRMLHDMARSIASHDPILERVIPVMTALRDRTKETVILGKRQEDQVIYLAVVESEQTIRYSARPGDFKPLHSTASGKVLLAAMSDGERRRLLDRLRLTSVTPRTITNVSALEEELRAGVVRGWQYAEGENVPDVIVLAAPVERNGEVYALVVTGPIHRMKREVGRHAKALLEACRRLDRDRSGPGATSRPQGEMAS